MENTIKSGTHFKHKEPRKVPHDHIVLYLGIHTETSERLVIHRPTHKIETIYCEPVDSFLERFSPAK